METRDWEAEGSFEERIESARAAIEGLARALHRRDSPAAMLAASQARRALEIAERSAIAIGVTDVERHDEVAVAVQRLQEAALPLLARVPSRMYGYASVRRFLARFRVETD